MFKKAWLVLLTLISICASVQAIDTVNETYKKMFQQQDQLNNQFIASKDAVLNRTDINPDDKHFLIIQIDKQTNAISKVVEGAAAAMADSIEIDMNKVMDQLAYFGRVASVFNLPTDAQALNARLELLKEWVAIRKNVGVDFNNSPLEFAPANELTSIVDEETAQELTAVENKLGISLRGLAYARVYAREMAKKYKNALIGTAVAVAAIGLTVGGMMAFRGKHGGGAEDKGQKVLRDLKAMPEDKALESLAGMPTETVKEMAKYLDPGSTDKLSKEITKRAEEIEKQEKAAAEALRKAEEAKEKEKAEKERKEKEAAEAKRKADEQAAAEAKRKADELAAIEAKRKADEQAAAEAKRKASEQAAIDEQRKADEEAAKRKNETAAQTTTRLAKEQADREAKERKDKEAKEKEEREAKERTEREAKAKADRDAREKAEKEAKAKAEQEARAKSEREARDKEKAKQQALLELQQSVPKKVKSALDAYADAGFPKSDWTETIQKYMILPGLTEEKIDELKKSIRDAIPVKKEAERAKQRSEPTSVGEVQPLSKNDLMNQLIAGTYDETAGVVKFTSATIFDGLPDDEARKVVLTQSKPEGFRKIVTQMSYKQYEEYGPDVQKLIWNNAHMTVVWLNYIKDVQLRKAMVTAHKKSWGPWNKTEIVNFIKFLSGASVDTIRALEPADLREDLVKSMKDDMSVLDNKGALVSKAKLLELIKPKGSPEKPKAETPAASS